MPIQPKVSGDPRRPAEVNKFQRPKVNLEEQPPDMFFLMALLLGMVSLAFKAKLPAWGSLLLCLCAVANRRAGYADHKQIVSSFAIAIFGLASSYLIPMRQRAAGGGGA